MKLRVLLAVLLAALMIGGCSPNAPVEEAQESTRLPTEGLPDSVLEDTREDIYYPGIVGLRDYENALKNLEVPDTDNKITMGEDAVVTAPVRGQPVMETDPHRRCYNVGTCKNLSGTPLVVCLFMDDNESSWTQAEADAFFEEDLFPGLQWLQQEAMAWQVELSYNTIFYITDSQRTLHYEGNIGALLQDGDASTDLLQQAALDLGFSSQAEMHQYLQDNHANGEDIIYVVAVEKPGRCHAWVDQSNEGHDYMEHVVLFGQRAYVGSSYYDLFATTVAHEILHVFGAEDYYSEGTLRVGRERLTKLYFKDDVMLSSFENYHYNYVGPYTAFTVGWWDRDHIVTEDPDWWS